MALSVRLAGYNLDADLLSDVVGLLADLERAAGELESGGFQSPECKEFVTALAERIRNRMDPGAFTPETISAAYARISRDPKQVTELRRAARFGVARARKSNENIIFGLGHASVAEHACFNFDILGLSRLASEELQSHRLVSFTEKSQRYITLTTDYVVPPEAEGTPLESLFHETVPRLFGGYKAVCDALMVRHLGKPLQEAGKDELKDAENRAKEDARYLLPLASTTQMGMTVNARMIEHIVRDLSDHPLQELRELGKGIYDAVHSLAPSVVKYVVRGTYPRANRYKLSEMLKEKRNERAPQVLQGPRAKLIESTPDGEMRVLEALGFASGAGDSSLLDTKAMWRVLFNGMGMHDQPPREFELASMTFEAMISASCFAQLKRHRMMTLLVQPYEIDAGTIIPPSLVEAGLQKPFEEAMAVSRDAARKLSEQSLALAPYLLTNAQQRCLRMHLNAREFYHLVRLRADTHAQWEIRLLAEAMLEQARALWPNLFMLACGKDKFEELYRRLFPE